MKIRRKIGKRITSVIMSIALLVPVFSVGFGVLNVTALEKTGNDAVVSDKCFFAPEAVYLQPSIASYTSQGKYNFQWFVDSEINKSAHTATPRTGENSSGNFYFYYQYANSISVSFKYLNTDFNDITAYTDTSTTNSGANYSNADCYIKFAASDNISPSNTSSDTAKTSYTVSGNTVDTTVTNSSVSPYMLANVSGCYIEWTVSFVDSRTGLTNYVKSYTYLYKPYIQPLGIGIRIQNNRGTDSYGSDVAWISGVHGLATTGSHYPHAQTGSGGMVPFSSSNALGVQLGDVGDKLYAQFANSTQENGYFQYSCNNTNPDNWFGTSGNTYFTTQSFNYVNNDRDGSSSGDNAFYAYGISPIGKMSIDSSRYTNLSQIPNLSIGLMVTDDEGTKDSGAWYIADYTGKTVKTAGDTGYQKNSTTTGENYWNDRNDILFGVGSFNSTVGGASNEGVKYNGKWLYNIATSNSTATYAFKTGYFNHDGSGSHYGGDTCWDFSVLQLTATLSDRTSLRSAYNSAASKSANLGMKADGSSYFYDSSSSYWTNFMNLYKAAGKLLTNIDSISSVTVNGTSYTYDLLASALNSAISSIENCRLSSTSTERHLVITKGSDGTYSLSTLSPDSTLSYQYGNELLFSSKTIENYVYVGYAANANRSSGENVGNSYASLIASNEKTERTYPTSANVSCTFFYVPRQVVSIAVTTAPTKQYYRLGNSADYSGLVITGTFNDNTTEALTGYTCSGFDSSTPNVCTITVKYNDCTTMFTVTVLGDADYSNVTAAKNRIPGDLSVYTSETVQNLNNAVNAVVYGLDITHQSEVDAYANAINSAINALVYKKADYTAVTNALNAVPNDLSNYTSETVNALNSAINSVVYNLDIIYQSQVDAYAKAIVDATAALKYKGADYSAVTAALSNVPKDLSLYTDSTVQPLNNAINAVVYNLDITHQSEVNAYAKAIVDATAALKYKGADYSAVTAALSNVPKDLSLYTDSTVQALNNAINAVVYNLDITHQSEVDAYAKAIVDATAALKYKDADYTAVTNALNAVPKDLSNYTSETVNALNAAINAVVYNLDITHQSEVNAYAKAIVDATAALKLKGADYSAVTAALNNVPKDLSLYTESTVQALNNAINAVVYNLDITHQSEVNAYAKAIVDATAALKYKGADYSAVTSALSNVPKDLSLYTDSTVQALNNAINAVVYNLDITHQSEVDTYANAIVDATAALKYKDADYTALNAALAKVPKYSYYYTTDSYAPVKAAVNAVVYNLNITHQSEIDQMTQNILNALSGLKLVNYTVTLPSNANVTYTDNPLTMSYKIATVSAPSSDENGKRFSYWVERTDSGDKIVSTYRNYSFYVCKNVKLVAIYGVDYTPAVIASRLMNIRDNGDGTSSILVEHSVSKSVDILSHGVLFTSDSTVAPNMTVDNENTKLYNAVAAKTATTRTGLLEVKIKNADAVVYARPYIIDSSGTVHYGDVAQYDMTGMSTASVNSGSLINCELSADTAVVNAQTDNGISATQNNADQPVNSIVNYIMMIVKLIISMISKLL